jgi:hypothetical protein
VRGEFCIVGEECQIKMEGELEGKMESAGISRDLSSRLRGEDSEAKITGRRQSSEDQASSLVPKDQRYPDRLNTSNFAMSRCTSCPS